MNKRAPASRLQILNMLVEGSSMRSIARVADVRINTVSKLLVDVGKACAAFHDKSVRGVKAKRVQCDEIWSFTYTGEERPDRQGRAGRCWRHVDVDSARCR